ncbi:unnamed protein product (macronuclear) [Paramecium tetraurelia]|uniref:B box-type domain-containing protein n=1 Tax=Paramecium tetraurelia TaxID=5888 RepID=A0D8U4_PARTE|nr:uncharacterized protein GSPATT00014407001 [Paramecium tetraurelia]CAK79461.1 unnamed protein product [Paramecium tetraurelia]|eukprot:XP_001446858.1 hypothetical protein (macronuclear) [Paramecium tetraurelia strain d4-2]
MNVNLICPQHKQQVIQACIDLDCSVFPFMCKVCMTDQKTISQHTKHNQCLIPYQQYVTLVSKQIEDQLHDANKFIDLFNKESQVVQQILLSDEHLNNMEGYVRSQKQQIESDVNQALESITQLFDLHKTELIKKLDQYLKIYENNFFILKEQLEPIHFLLTKCKYYSNENNLKQKLHTKPDLGSQLKLSIKQMSIIKKPDNLKQILDKVKKAQELQYNNENFNKLLTDAKNSINDFYIKNVSIPNQTQIEIQQQTNMQPTVQTLSSPPIKSKLMDISNADKATMLDDNKTVISAVDSKISVVSQLQTQVIPNINVLILDNRIIEDTNQSKNQSNQRFKIKKKLSIEFQVTSLALVSNVSVALGLADGTVKLLDMTTSKVSFYPNTYIQHTKPVSQLLILKQNKGTRLASLSEENYAIIWTLGENYVPYPERKLIGFKSKLNRIMDVADSSHLICQSDTNLQIINYHDNRIAYSFEFKTKLIDFLYVSKYEKFATICQGNIVSIYSLKMNNNLQGAMLLVNCELEYTQSALPISNISSCIATEYLNDIIICYGCTDGSVKLFNVIKNILIAEYQLFNSKIQEMIIVKQNKHFILVAFGESVKQIKGIMIQENKINPIEMIGELLEYPAKSGKNVIQTFFKNRSSFYLLSDSQKDIGLYELC